MKKALLMSAAALTLCPALAHAQAAKETPTWVYVAPGVNHCHGGPGADETDLLAALDLWVTKGRAPATLAAKKLDASGAVVRSMPLCRYPKYPRYAGPTDDAEAAKLSKNYTCTSPDRVGAPSR